MNPDNVCTREAAERLQKAGIPIETDAVWVKPALTDDWFLCSRDDWKEIYPFNKVIPAPSLTEVWRELPGGSRLFKIDDEDTIADIETECISKIDTNPADAAIDLLIWVKGGGSNERL